MTRYAANGNVTANGCVEEHWIETEKLPNVFFERVHIVYLTEDIQRFGHIFKRQYINVQIVVCDIFVLSTFVQWLYEDPLAHFTNFFAGADCIRLSMIGCGTIRMPPVVLSTVQTKAAISVDSLEHSVERYRRHA